MSKPSEFDDPIIERDCRKMIESPTGLVLCLCFENAYYPGPWVWQPSLVGCVSEPDVFHLWQ